MKILQTVVVFLLSIIIALAIVICFFDFFCTNQESSFYDTECWKLLKRLAAPFLILTGTLVLRVFGIHTKKNNNTKKT